MPNESVFGLGNLSTWQAAAQEAGYTSREALAEFHDVGGGFINFRTWDRNWAEVENYRTALGATTDYDLETIPTTFVDLAVGPGGQYAMNVRVQLQNNTTGEFMTSFFYYQQPEAFPASQALAAAADVFGAGISEAGESYAYTLVGMLPGPPILTTPYGT